MLLTAALAWLHSCDSQAAPPTTDIGEDPTAHLLAEARALKQARPELFGAADGILVTLIVSGSQGAAAGLSPGDVLIGYGGTPIGSVRQMTAQIGITPENSRIMLSYLRGEERREVAIRGGRIGVGLQDLAETPFTRMIALLQRGQQALAIRREIGDPGGEAEALMGIGIAYKDLGRLAEALSELEQALAIHRQLDDRSGEGAALSNIGMLHANEGQSSEAERLYRQALVIETEVGEPEILWRLWDGLRRLWSARSRYGPAIVAGKRAVNTLQAMRTVNANLERHLQQSFLEDKEQVYRGLADDLITAGRIAEAEQVLAMLKEEELFDFIRRGDAGDIRQTRATPTPTEAAWNARYQGFSADLATPEVQLARQSLIGSEALNELIGRFRQALMTPASPPPLALGQALYDHLVRPIAADLERAGSQTLMWSLDGAVHLDDGFDARRLKRVIRKGYPVLHIASHFELNPGDNSASFLLLGDGGRLTLEDFQLKRAYRLDAVDLLTLSACNTAIGAVGSSSSGAEVESFGALAQKRGAKGVLASLWPVADQSTGTLMQALYKLRRDDARYTKAEALRRAQVMLLRGNDPEQPCGPSRGKRRSLTSDQRPAQRETCRYSHPYYWAPFILMGNWL